MSDQGGDTRFEILFRLDAALIRIKALEADVAASEHNFRTMRQSRNEAAARIEALEAALRMIERGCALGPDFVIDKTEHSMLIKIQRIALAALAPEQDK